MFDFLLKKWYKYVEGEIPNNFYVPFVGIHIMSNVSHNI